MSTLSRRQLATGAVAAAATLAISRSTPAVADAYGLVAPELRPFTNERAGARYTFKNVEAMRAWQAQSAGPTPLDRMIPGPRGAPKVRVVVIDPKPEVKDKPALLYIHGGGHMFGVARPDDPNVIAAIEACGCVVVSVAYRLSPETRYPGPLEDCYAALAWLFEHAEDLGVDRRRIAVGGESSGGCLAASLAILARDRGAYRPAFQLLIYPMLDDRTGSTRDPPQTMGQFVWGRAANRLGWTSYLGVAAGSAKVPAGAVPAREKNLRGLPPAFIAVGSIDLFVEEDTEYARRLIAAGVPTELYVLPGAFHGFDEVAPDTRIVADFRKRWSEALRRGLGVAAAA